MKSNFEERRANKLEAFERLAEKNEDLSTQHYERAKEISSYIPFGQPILVGHHSEGRHRRDLGKIDNNMRKSVEADEKAEYYKRRIETLLNGTAISSDDPNAIDKLKEKLENLEALQELMKAVNKIVKSKRQPAEQVTAIMDLGISETRAQQLIIKGEGYHNQPGFASYRLTNNNATIRNTRERIAHLEKIAAIETTEEVINGITLCINAEDNRVQLFFPGIPSEKTRKQLKGYGFHWTPSIKCWQRQISGNAIYYAKEILKSLTPKKDESQGLNELPIELLHKEPNF